MSEFVQRIREQNSSLILTIPAHICREMVLKENEYVTIILDRVKITKNSDDPNLLLGNAVETS